MQGESVLQETFLNITKHTPPRQNFSFVTKRHMNPHGKGSNT